MREMGDADIDIEDRNGKSAAAFRTISEVADELDLAQHVLRFWESKFPQVKPLKRGGGRRYYRPEDVVTLKEIQALLYNEGYTIKGAQKLLRQKRSTGLPVASEPKASKPPPATKVAKPLPVKPPVLDIVRLRDELKDMRARLGDLLVDNG